MNSAPQTPPPWRGGAYTGKLQLSDVPDWVLQANLPQWLQSKGGDAGRYRQFLTGNPNAPGVQKMLDLYGTYLKENPTARGNRILFNRYGLTSQNGFKAPAPAPTGAAPAPPAASPAPAPSTPRPVGVGSGGAAPGGPPALAPTPLPPSFGGMGGNSSGMTDIYSVYRSAVPVMERERDQQISDAMAKAGFTGNRYGTAAIRTAGEIGAETAFRQNQLLTSLMHDQGNRDLDRALNATNISLNAARLEDELTRNRLSALFGFGQWEQGRQDDLARYAHQDWNANKYGLLPMLIQFAASQSGGSAPTPYQIVQPGKPGAADWISLLGSLF